MRTCPDTSTASPTRTDEIGGPADQRSAFLRLIKMWLEAPVEEIDDRGRQHRTTRNKDEGRGTPQGSPLSPLLANIYMRRFVLGWKALGHERRLDAHIVNYADDFVICCRGTADEAMRVMRAMMSKLRLTVNETKTHLCRLPEEGVNFLGYTIGRCHSPRTGRSYIGTKPSAKKIDSLKAEIHEKTSRRWLWTTVEDRVAELNRSFWVGRTTSAWDLSARPTEPLTATRASAPPVASREAQVQSRGTTRFPDARLMTIWPHPLVRPSSKLSVGEGLSSCPRAGCGKSACTVR